MGDGNQPRALAEIMVGRVVDAGMLDGTDPDFGLRVEDLCEVMQEQVVRLGRAAGPDDIDRMTAEEAGEFFTRVGHGFVRRHSERVWAGGVAVNSLRSFKPGFAGLTQDGCSGVVIEINHPWG